MEYVNLPTVAVVAIVAYSRENDKLVPGVMLIRRNRKGDDGYGMLALPGGFQKGNEKQNIWDAAIAEVFEETGLKLTRDELCLRDIETDEYGHNVVFFVTYTPDDPKNLIANFKCVDDEVSELVFSPRPKNLAFPLHEKVANDVLYEESLFSIRF